MPLVTDKEKVAHLLRRFGLGASEAELDYYGRDGYRTAVDRLLAETEEGPTLALADTAVAKNGNIVMPGVLGWYAARILTTRNPLREKMTLFWHDHFATSAEKVKSPLFMAKQNGLLHRGALGPFRELLGSVSKDPAMILWLDVAENRRGRPNENFAREVMELFTMGEGSGYTEHDIQEAARAFTGWGYARNRDPDLPKTEPRAEFRFRPAFHDDGPKTILGKTGAFDGDGVFDLLCDDPRTARYLVRKMWTWFAYPDPSDALVERLATGWRKGGMVTADLVRAIALSPEFLSPKADRAVYKSPFDFCVPLLRGLGVGAMLQSALAGGSLRAGSLGRGAARGRFPGSAIAVTSMKNMGQWLLYPPDVAGWEGGASWISSATMVERMAFADRLFNTGSALKGPRLNYPAMAILGSDPTPKGVVRTLLSLYDAPVKVERQRVLVDAATKAIGPGLDPRNAPKVAATVSRLIFATPEFQMM